jgi:hypothetical protein
MMLLTLPASSPVPSIVDQYLSPIYLRRVPATYLQVDTGKFESLAGTHSNDASSIRQQQGPVQLVSLGISQKFNRTIVLCEYQQKRS